MSACSTFEDIKHRVRASDPLTSLHAAEHSALFAGSHSRRILAALARGRMTAHEIASATGLTVVQVDRRLPEMRERGEADVVQENGADLIRSGYRVWLAIEKTSG